MRDDKSPLLMVKLISLVFGIMVWQVSAAQDAASDKRIGAFNVETGKPAIQGYDPVDYFARNKATKGTAQYTYNYNGIIYRFASAENLAVFKKAPDKYEPQYGGWCAFAMGNDGSKVEVDPETFRIHDGKLYLFYNKFFNNTLKTWLKSEPDLRKKADNNWPKHYH